MIQIDLHKIFPCIYANKKNIQPNGYVGFVQSEFQKSIKLWWNRPYIKHRYHINATVAYFLDAVINS